MLAMDKNETRIFTIPNFLSTVRLLFLAPIWYFLSRETPRADMWAILLLVPASLTDFFDGYLARKFQQRSNLGKVLDPVVDKIFIGSLALLLVFYRNLPAWFLMAVLARDGVILLFAAMILRKKRVITESNFIGKCTLWVLTFVLLVYMLRLHVVEGPILIVALVLLILSLVSYSRKFLHLLEEETKFSPGG